MESKDVPGSSGHNPLTLVERGRGQVFLHAGYQFYKKKTIKDGINVYECNQRRQRCRGSVKIQNNKIIQETQHSHAPDFAKNILDTKLHKVKQDVKALQGSKTVPEIYKEAVSTLKDDGLDLINIIPPLQSVKTVLYRKRNNALLMEQIMFSNLEKVVIPPKYEPFLLADYNYEGHRITVFCAKDMRNLFCQLHDFLSDGTFKSCPEPFLQLYTIHADFGTKNNKTIDIIPVAYALMSHKDQQSYEILFNIIKSQIPEWTPQTYKTDFETAAMKAIKNVFPDVIVKGCFFHYKKAVWKQGYDLGLTKSKILKRQVALSAVLPLAPEHEILNGWSYIATESPDDDKSENFRSYMLRQWIKVQKADFRKMWCAFNERHRTTNFLEGWHNGLNKAVGKKKPNIDILLRILQKDAAFYRVISQQIQNGVAPATNHRSRKDIMNDEFIHECQIKLVSGELTIGHFLEKLR